jgi:hypothetical protein
MRTHLRQLEQREEVSPTFLFSQVLSISPKEGRLRYHSQ